VEIVYGAGWDVVSRVFVGAVPVAEARRRDAAGEPVSVGVVLGDHVVAVLDRHGWYMGLWLLDPAGRRVLMADFRELAPDRLMLRQIRGWRFSEGEQEGDRGVGRYSVTVDLEYECARVSYEPKGAAGSSRSTTYPLDVEGLWQARPVLEDQSRLLPSIPLAATDLELFGRWDEPPRLTALQVPLLAGAVMDDPVDPMVMARLVDDAPTDPSWTAPVPDRAPDFETWFSHGATVTFNDQDNGGQLSVISAGVLRMPTGRWMATEPGWSTPQFKPFTVTIPPGAYPVRLVLVHWDSGHQGGAAAIRLDLTDGQVVTWEMALRERQDVRMLGDGEFYGFGVDGGMASLLDEAAFPVIQALSAPDVEFDEAYGWASDPGWADLTIPGVDANVIAVTAAMGDGAYPTWIGRTGTGEIASVVVDLEILRTATIEP
jgi:hypothetical protein